MSTTPGVDELVTQIRSYLAGQTEPGAFVQRYQDGYKELGALDQPTFVALDRLFFVCEDYYDDPLLRDPGDTDEEALRAAAEQALVDLDRRA